ncbi:MAG: hypothetical protein ISR43_01870 [Acidimicrobiia bacterium]|nr:hypothetical protein [Actinomycetota bacterium]MBL6925959.1 hypothetical protein [Acidimicrobiia bacterium]
MKAGKVLLALGLLASGCASEEWSESAKDVLVNECVTSIQNEMDADWQFRRAMQETGLSAPDACRCLIENLVEEFSEDDFEALGFYGQREAVKRVTSHCRTFLLESLFD